MQSVLVSEERIKQTERVRIRITFELIRHQNAKTFFFFKERQIAQQLTGK